MSQNQVKTSNNQVFLVEVINEKNELELYTSNEKLKKEIYGVDFKGQLITSAQLKKIEKNLVLEISAEKQMQLCIPWHRVVKIRNISFEKK